MAQRHKIGRVLARYPVLCFFLLTYAITWLCVLPFLLAPPDKRLAFAPLALAGKFGPTLSALILAGLFGGARGAEDLLSRLVRWRVKLWWYLFALLGLGGLIAAAVALHVSLGGRLGEAHPGQVFSLAPLFLVRLFVGGGLGEELGWRGFALPRLQENYSALTASLIIGVVWTCWHLPDFWLSGTREAPFGLFLLLLLPLSVLYTWVYNSTQGSVLLVALMHAAGNATMATIDNVFPSAPNDLQLHWLLIGLLSLAALLVIAIYGPARLAAPQGAG